MSQLPANGAEGASIPVSVTAVDAKNADASVPHVVAHVPPPCGDAPPPAAATPGSERKRKKKEPRDETKPKKPMSGFLLWMNNPDEKLKIVGGATDMSHKEFTQKAGIMWKAMTDKEQQPWLDSQKEKFEKFYEELAAWKVTKQAEIEAMPEETEEEKKAKEEAMADFRKKHLPKEKGPKRKAEKNDEQDDEKPAKKAKKGATPKEEKPEKKKRKNDQREFEVEAIVDRRKSTTEGSEEDNEYLVKWVGWDHEDNTWEPICNLEHSLEMIATFDKQYSGESVVMEGVLRRLSSFTAEDAEATIALFKDCVKGARSFKGCVQYDLLQCQDEGKGSSFQLVEAWTDEEALSEFAKSEKSVELKKALEEKNITMETMTCKLAC